MTPQELVENYGKRYDTPYVPAYERTDGTFEDCRRADAKITVSTPGGIDCDVNCGDAVVWDGELFRASYTERLESNKQLIACEFIRCVC